MRGFKNNRGLTLVELLATLVILAIIATITVLFIDSIIVKTEARAIVADGVKLIEAAKIAELNGDKATKLSNPHDPNGGKVDFYTARSLKPYLSVNFDEVRKNFGWNGRELPGVSITEIDGHVQYDLWVSNSEDPFYGHVRGRILNIGRSKVTSKYAPVAKKHVKPEYVTEQQALIISEEDLLNALEGKNK